MASAKPSFLQAYQPPPGSEQDRVLLLQDAPSANSNASTSSIGNSGLNGPASSSSRASHGRSHGYKRRKQWQAADSSGVDGLVFYSLAAAVACGVGMYYAWKWWQKHQRGRATCQTRQQQPQASHSGQGSRSAFSFDKPGKGGKGKKKGQGGTSQGPPAVKTPPIPPASQLRQEPIRAGNAKKDKALRRERKADKQARKQAAKEQAEQVRVAGERAAEATGKEDPAVVTYIDYDRTSEAFQRVKDWQETGKKRYD